jgi:glyoxylase-like metal-dependent hydrolase (beta-lactamase superfamily II)
MKTIRLSKTNCFYLKRQKVLIDTGYAHDEAAFRRGLARAGIPFSAIDYVVLTHHHDDHCGLVGLIGREHPSVKVVLHRLCEEELTLGENSRKEGGYWASHGMRRLAGLYKRVDRKWTLKFPPFATRSHDMVIDFTAPVVDFLDCKLIYAPGHTLDSICLMDPEGRLYLGDAAANYLKWAGTKYAPAFITDVDRFYESWRLILSLKPKMLYPAHGAPFKPIMLERFMDSIKKESIPAFKWE